MTTEVPLTISATQAGLAKGKFNCVDLVDYYLSRIENSTAA